MEDHPAPTLAPETSSTPRHSLSGPQEPPSPTGRHPSNVSVQWISVDLEALLPASRQPLRIHTDRDKKELVLRSVVLSTSDLTHRKTQQIKFSTDDIQISSARWLLPPNESIIDVSDLASSPSNAVVVQLTLTPRRSGTWELGATVAITRSLLDAVQSSAVQVSVTAGDQGQSSIGITQLVISRSSPQHSPRASLVEWAKTPGRARFTISQVMPRQAITSKASFDATLEFFVLGTDRGYRTRQWSLSQGSLLPVPEVVVMEIDDIHVQVISIRLYRHSAKERPQRIAEAMLSLSAVGLSGSQEISVPMMHCEDTYPRQTPSNNRAYKSEAFHGWGQVVMTTTIEAARAEPTSSDQLAASLMRSEAHVAMLSDVRGRLDIELREVLLSESIDVALASTLALQWTILPDTTVIKTSTALDRGVRRAQLNDANSSTGIHWSTKERQIPSLHLSVNLVSQDEQDKRSNGCQAQVSTHAQLSGECDLHLSVLFAFPSEWLPLELPITLTSATTSSTIRLALCMRVVSSTTKTSETKEREHTFLCRGHLHLSSLRVEGSFLKQHRPQSSYTFVLKSPGGSDMASTLTLSPDASKLSLSPPLALSCRLMAPVATLQVFRSVPGTDDRVLVANTTMPLPPSVTVEKHLVSLSLPLASSSSTSKSTPVKKCGVVSFDAQFIDDDVPASSTSQPTTSLRIHHIMFNELPPTLAASISSHALRLSCELSLVGGPQLSDVLWSQKKQAVDLRPLGALQFVVDLLVHVPAHIVVQLNTGQTVKSMLIVKLHTRDAPLAQAVVSIRGGWAAFAQVERLAWHKLYAVERRREGNPTAIGEIQLSVETLNGELSDADTSDIEGWIFVQVMDAILTRSSSTMAARSRKQEAVVVFMDAASPGKPRKTLSQWSADGQWQWSDAIIALPVNDKSTTVSVQLLIDETVNVPVTQHSPLHRYMRPPTEGYIDDWLSGGDADNEAVLHVRVSYLPLTSGRLTVAVHSLLSVITPTIASTLPVSRFALRWGSGFAKCSAASEPVDLPIGGMCATHLHPLGREKLALQMSVSSRLPAGQERRLPVATLQLIGYAAGLNDELCIGEGSVSLTAIFASQVSTPPPTQWVALYSKHDPSLRVAIAQVQCDFLLSMQPPVRGGDNATLVFASHHEWQQASGAVLALWKKLFYTLDVDKNDRIDVTEFTALFLKHADVFKATTDGQSLLRVLLHGQRLDQEHDSMAVSRSVVASLFDKMDRNGDQSIEWLEFVGFMQCHLLALEPASSVEPKQVETRVEEPVTLLSTTENVTNEKRRKRREDPQRMVRSRAPSTLPSLSPSTASEDNTEEEVAHLRAQLSSLVSRLSIEQQRTSVLQDELRALRQSHRQLQLQQERSALEAKTTTEYLQQAIKQHELALQQRAVTRAKHHTASIVLQSKVRARLEQKRYHALKLTRAHAAQRIQCAYRCYMAHRRLRALQTAEHERRRRVAAASALHRFVRWHLRRKERWLLKEASHVSAVVIQKYARRMLATKQRCKAMDAVERLQCVLRGQLARRRAVELRVAVATLRHVLRGWICRWRLRRQHKSVVSVQRWWRVANARRWEYVTQLEAAVCIQAMWRGVRLRLKWQQSSVEVEEEEARSDAFESLLLMDAAMGDASLPAERGEANAAIDCAVPKTEEVLDHVREVVAALVDAATVDAADQIESPAFAAVHSPEYNEMVEDPVDAVRQDACPFAVEDCGNDHVDVTNNELPSLVDVEGGCNDSVLATDTCDDAGDDDDGEVTLTSSAACGSEEHTVEAEASPVSSMETQWIDMADTSGPPLEEPEVGAMLVDQTSDHGKHTESCVDDELGSVVKSVLSEVVDAVVDDDGVGESQCSGHVDDATVGKQVDGEDVASSIEQEIRSSVQSEDPSPVQSDAASKEDGHVLSDVNGNEGDQLHPPACVDSVQPPRDEEGDTAGEVTTDPLGRLLAESTATATVIDMVDHREEVGDAFQDVIAAETTSGGADSDKCAVADSVTAEYACDEATQPRIETVDQQHLHSADEEPAEPQNDATSATAEVTTLDEPNNENETANCNTVESATEEKRRPEASSSSESFDHEDSLPVDVGVETQPLIERMPSLHGKDHVEVEPTSTDTIQPSDDSNESESRSVDAADRIETSPHKRQDDTCSTDDSTVEVDAGSEQQLKQELVTDPTTSQALVTVSTHSSSEDSAPEADASTQESACIASVHSMENIVENAEDDLLSRSFSSASDASENLMLQDADAVTQFVASDGVLPSVHRDDSDHDILQDLAAFTADINESHGIVADLD